MEAIEPVELDQMLEQARSTLRRIPGVLGVGYGYKIRAGSVTRELSWVVFVRKKQPIAELPPAEVIPGELYGVHTDVLTAPSLRALACAVHDKFEILVGGIMISNLKRYSATGSLVGDVLGTLGFFGTLNSSTSLDNIVGLTNNHVLTPNSAAVGDTIFQPKITGPSGSFSLTRDDMHPIGTIQNLGMQGNHPYGYSGDPVVTPAPQYYLDCGAIKINTNFSSCCRSNKGMKFGNLVHDLDKTALGSGVIEGIARVRNSDLAASTADYKVYKVGEHTGWTTGKVHIAEMDWDDPVDSTLHYGTSIIIANLGPNCGGGAEFAVGGDSGAVVVNSDRKIIGLLIGELPGLGGFYVACHIHPLLHYLGVTMVSTQHLAGASGGATSLEASLSLDENGGDVACAIALREEILNSERGRRYHTLIQQHMDEVVHLVNRVRPVTVAWHRVHGPDFLGHMLHAARHAEHSVPRELHGLARDEALTRLLEILALHGSATLRAAIERHSGEVHQLLDRVDDIETLAEQLRETEPREHLV